MIEDAGLGSVRSQALAVSSLQVGSTRPRRRYRHDYCAVGATRVSQATEQRPQC
jgi:hypothetical protein